jgi:sulfate transport system ATP-binding protein
MRIRLDGVGKRFDGVHAVRDVSLEIGSGELVALLGPSGSGKTTLLRMVAGLAFPDTGRILFGDVDATDIPVRDRGVGFVFQHYALFPHMRVADNIAFGMRAARDRRPEAAVVARVDDLLSLMQLDGLGSRFPAQLSGGQRQRVALARALAVDPQVLLLDEPFGALDANVRRELRRWLREMHERLGITTLFVTHDQEEALDLADRVVILDHGRIEQVGAPRELCREPASAFVMTFLGDTHRLPASVEAGIATVAGRVRHPAQSVPDGAAWAFVRPADVAWRPDATEDDDAVPARLVRVLDRPGSRRLVARTVTGDEIELDVGPENDSEAGDDGGITLLRARIFPAIPGL